MESRFFDKEAWGVRIVKANQFLGKPLTMLIIIAILILFVFVYFVIDNKRIIRETNASARDAAIAAEQSRIASQNSEIIIANQQRDIDTLKAEIAKGNRFTACLLAVHDAGEFVQEDVATQCERMSENVGLEDVTRQPTTSNTPPIVTPQAPQNNNSNNNSQSDLGQRIGEILRITPNRLILNTMRGIVR